MGDGGGGDQGNTYSSFERLFWFETDTTLKPDILRYLAYIHIREAAKVLLLSIEGATKGGRKKNTLVAAMTVYGGGVNPLSATN